MNPETGTAQHVRESLPETAETTGSSRHTGLVTTLCIALVIIISAVYAQVGNQPFLNMDDNTYVTDNFHVASGITAQNIAWAFTSVDAANWHPLTWLSHMTDARLYGMNPRGHHLTNVVLHIISSLLLFLFLLRVTGAVWRSVLVAALFALHPLHVESVAWVAERKDVLSGLFWFLTLLLYCRYAATRSAALYAVTLVCFVLGLMAKPMLVTLPLVMLLLDYWPLGRCRSGKQGEPGFFNTVTPLIKEKIPFFVCSLLSASITIYAQQKGGALADIATAPLLLRIENALVAYVTYIAKTLWPQDLAPLYLFPAAIPLWQAAGALVILLLTSVATIRLRQRAPWLAVGWFWFIITLVPVIGLVKVGSQSMADRYSYIPLTGLFIMAAWGVPELLKRMAYRKAICGLLAGAAICISTTLTWQQLGYWQDNISLYRHTLQATTGSDIIHTNLGLALAIKGDTEGAMQEYRNALRINPGFPGAHNGLGAAFQAQGFWDAAISEYREALRLSPAYSDAFATHNNLALVLSAKGDLAGAIREYQEALRINSDNADVHFNLALALSSAGNVEGAIREYRETLRLNPNDRDAQKNLAAALARKW
jgi:tetratricopeptide (TPR) repeat protein